MKWLGSLPDPMPSHSFGVFQAISRAMKSKLFETLDQQNRRVITRKLVPACSSRLNSFMHVSRLLRILATLLFALPSAHSATFQVGPTRTIKDLRARPLPLFLLRFASLRLSVKPFPKIETRPAVYGRLTAILRNRRGCADIGVPSVTVTAPALSLTVAPVSDHDEAPAARDAIVDQF